MFLVLELHCLQLSTDSLSHPLILLQSERLLQILDTTFVVLARTVGYRSSVEDLRLHLDGKRECRFLYDFGVLLCLQKALGHVGISGA